MYLELLDAAPSSRFDQDGRDKILFKSLSRKEKGPETLDDEIGLKYLISPLENGGCPNGPTAARAAVGPDQP
jgi:hypothetical protein